MKLLTQEMVDEVLKRAEDPEVAEKFKELMIGIIVVCTDCPGNEDRQLMVTFADGKLADLQLEVQPAPGDMRTAPFDETKFDAKVIIPYWTFCEELQQKISLLMAMGHLKIEGDLPKLMNQVEGFTNLLQFIGSLPIEY